MSSLPAVKNIEAHPIFDESGATVFNLGFTPTVGNILLFAFATRVSWSTATISSAGATWVQIGTEVVNTGNRLIAYHSGVLTAAPASVTVTFPTTQHGAIIIAELENVNALDTATPVANTGSSNPAAAGSFTANAGGLVVALLARADGDVSDFFTGITPGDFSVELQANGLESPTSTKQTLAVLSGLLVAPESRTVTGDMGGADNWTSLIFGFVSSSSPSLEEPETRVEVEERSWTLAERGLITSDLVDHIRAGIARLIVQYRTQPKLGDILSSWLVQCQDLEENLWDVHQIRDINVATGVHLDRLGAIVGQPRGSLTDAQYRIWINARILANRTRSTPDEILEILQVVEPNAELGFTEYYPAGYILEAYGVSDNVPLVDIMSAVKPAGVAAELWTTTIPAGNLFEFADDTIVTDVDKGLSDDEVTDPGGALIDIVELEL